MLQLNPPLPVRCPKGRGLAHILIDYGPEHHLLWTIFITEGEHSGEIWTYANPEVRAETNPTMGRTGTTTGFSWGPPVDLAAVYIGGTLEDNGTFTCKFGPSPDRDKVIDQLDVGDSLVVCSENKRRLLGTCSGANRFTWENNGGREI